MPGPAAPPAEGSITPTDEEIAAARQAQGGDAPPPPEGIEALLAGVPEAHRDTVRRAAEASAKERERSLLADYTQKTTAIANERKRLERFQEEWNELQGDPDFLEYKARKVRGPAAAPVDVSAMPLEQAIPTLVRGSLQTELAPILLQQQRLEEQIRREALGREVDRCTSIYGEDFTSSIDAVDAVLDKAPTMPIEWAYLVVKGRASLEGAKAELNRREQDKLARARTNRSVAPPSPGQTTIKPTGKVRSFADAYRLGLADKEAAQ